MSTTAGKAFDMHYYANVPAQAWRLTLASRATKGTAKRQQKPL